MTQAPQLRALGGALGTEVLGIDLSKPLETGTFAGIQATFAEHPVLVFRDQNLGALELAAFGRRFGLPRPHALIKYRHVAAPAIAGRTSAGSCCARSCTRTEGAEGAELANDDRVRSGPPARRHRDTRARP
jgi:alpha-ketoglutarate-dependent taurine dioxygenase